MMMADSGSGTARRSPGGTGCRAIWQWTHSRGVGGGKRQRARKHLIQGDAQRVEIAAGINRTIHAAGLLGRHVGKGAGNDFRRRGCLTLVRPTIPVRAASSPLSVFWSSRVLKRPPPINSAYEIRFEETLRTRTIPSATSSSSTDTRNRSAAIFNRVRRASAAAIRRG